MKDIKVKSLAKLIMILSIVFTMLFSTFVPIISFAAENNDNESDISDKVNFTVAWTGNNVSNFYGDQTYAALFNLKLSGVRSGFKNLKITVVQDKETPRTTIDAKSSNQSNSLVNSRKTSATTIVFNDTVDSGVETGGTIKFTFARKTDFQDYDKSLQVILTGEYVDNKTGETEYINIVKDLSVMVQTKDVTDAFSSDIHLGTSGSSGMASAYHSSIGLREDEFVTTSIGVNIPINVKGHNVTFAKYTLRIKRTTSGYDTATLNSDANSSVSFSGVPDYMHSNVSRESDGTIRIDITVGEEKEEYTENDLFDYSTNMSAYIGYTVIEDTSRGGAGSTSINYSFTGEADGYTLTKGKTGTNYSEQHDSYGNSFNENISLAYYLGDYLANADITGTNRSKTEWEDNVANGNTDFTWKTDLLYWDRETIDPNTHESHLAVDSKLRVEGYKVGCTPNLKYISDEGTYETMDLTAEELRLKKITVTGYDGSWEYIDFYKKGETTPFFRAEPGNWTYVAPEGEDIGEYYAVFDYMRGHYYNSYPKWEATYTLNIDKLKETLSDEEILNIKAITKYQQGFFAAIDNRRTEASCTITVPSVAAQYSYYDMSVSGLSTSVGNYGVYEDATVTLRMAGDTKKTEGLLLTNKNPKFFIELPECFDYKDFDVSVTGGSGTIIVSNKGCTDSSEQAVYLDKDKKMLVVNCYGTWKKANGVTSVVIKFKRKLNTYMVESNNPIKSYMITDNANYVNYEVNSRSLSKNGQVPSYISVASSNFTISNEDVVKIRNGMIVDGDEVYPSETSDKKIGTKNVPVKAKSGETVTYKTELAANGSTLKNLSIICKLPFANNTSITGDTYSLDSAITLTNLANIKVKRRRTTTESDVAATNYTIKYSTDANANFDSTWTDYTEGDTGIANAKAIKVDFIDTYTLSSQDFLSVFFDMDMPSTDGKAGQISACKYKKGSSEDYTVLEPSAVYVERGIPEGTLHGQKIFQGYAAGSAPEGVSLENIEFKIVDIDTNEPVVISGQTDENGIFKTNAQGEFTVTGIPRGNYELVEVSQFDKYNGIGYTPFEVENGEEITLNNLINTPKTVKLIIQKSWELSGLKQQGSVRLRVLRTGDSISWQQYVDTDPTTGKVEIEVPIGKYQIQESQGLTGWKMSGTNVTTVVDEDGKTINITNALQRCTLKITKKVPAEGGESETVNGIKLRINGAAYAGTYINEQGEEVDLDYDNTITIGEEQDGITQTISDDGKQAVIIIPGIYAGNYMITEVDAPTIEVEGVEMSRYADLVRSVSLNADTTNEVLLENTWKRGKVKIFKTAEEGVELNQFKFRIHGTSYYGSNVDQIVDINSQGEGTANVVIGNYTIEEVGTNAFNSFFEKEVNGQKTWQADSLDIKVTGDKTVIVNAKNETAYGYVKINKLLEGKEDDPSAAEGIKFELTGVAPSGANIDEEIVIGHDGTGTSNAIPAGGEYVLNEVSETVPENYEYMEEMVVDLTKAHTQEHPLELNITDHRGKGRLEMTTETNPEGGPLYPITYKVQEIIINDEDGTYERIENTQQTIDGDMNGKAILNDLPAGTYIVSQQSIPRGWKKDVPQIIDVPMDDTAYANFLIEKEDVILNTKVTVNKKILNPAGEVATDSDFTKYRLIKDQSFEVKLTNQVSGKEYFVFTSPSEAGIICGLPEGRYKVEEVFKPKYTMDGLYLINNGQKEAIEPESDNYYIEIGSEEDGKNEVTIQFENKINEKFGFGGQDSKDNISTTDVEEATTVVANRAVIFVCDEDGNKIDGCTFEIYNSDGEKVADFSPTTKQTQIKGFDAGVYTIKNVGVPNGYLLANDEIFAVYDDAVRTVRIEIQKNIPRGNLTLQTVYTDDKGKTKNVAKSQYMIVNSETGEVLRFDKTADGSYRKSNLPTSSEVVSLRAGKVTLKGVETGTYEVGLVGIADGYGIAKTSDVEITEIVQNETQEITVNAVPRKIVAIEATYYDNYILDNFGTLYGWGYNSSSYCVGNGKTSGDVKEPIEIAQNVDKISMGYYGRAYIDKDGELWVWGYNYDGLLGIGASTSTTIPSPTHVNLVYADGTKVKAKEVAVGYYSTLVIDENNKLWYAGYKYSAGLGSTRDGQFNEDINEFICMHDIENSPYEGITPVKVCSGYNTNYILDDEGMVWSWSYGSTDRLGYQYESSSESYWVTCISLKPGNDLYEAHKQGRKVVFIDEGMAIDDEGNLYTYNSNNGIGPNYAYCQTSEGRRYAGKKFIKGAANKSSSSSSDTGSYAFIDDENKLYLSTERGGTVSVNEIEYSGFENTVFTDVSVGYYGLIALDKYSNLYGSGYMYDSYGLRGAPNSTQDIKTTVNSMRLMEYQTTKPSYPAYFKYKMRFQKVESCYYGTIALDDDGNLWTWGESNYYNTTGNSTTYVTTPRRVELNEDVKFKDISADKNSYYQMYAIDTKGRLWTWGYTGYPLSGAGVSSFYMARTCVSELTYKNNPLAVAYSEGVRLEEIKTTYNLVIARDNNNKTWIWGPGASSIVTGIDVSVPYCLGNAEGLQEFYESGNYIKEASLFCGYLVFIDKDGKLWYFNASNGLQSPTAFYNEENPNVPLEKEILTNDLRFSTLSGYSSQVDIIDEYGRLWYKSSPTYSVCYSTYEGCPLAEEYANGTKMVSVYFENYSDATGIDSKGRIWYHLWGSSPEIKADQANFAYCRDYNGSYLALDDEGIMWIWGSNSNYKLGNGTTLSILNPTKTTEKTKNESEGIKYIDVSSYGGESEEGYIYTFSNGVTKGRQTFTYLRNQGINVVKTNSYDICISDDGKVYKLNGKEFECKTDIEDSDLHAAYEQGVTMVDFTEVGSSTYMVDSNNHLWTIGSLKQVTTFLIDKVLSNEGGNTIVKDTEGNDWINGSNSEGLLGNGDSSVRSSEVFIPLVLADDVKIDEILYKDAYVIFVKDTDGIIWCWGNNDLYQLGYGNSNDNIYTPYCWNVEVDKIIVEYFSGYYRSDNDRRYDVHSVIVLDKDGAVWTTGYGGSYGEWTYGLQGKTYESLGKVNNSANMGRIVDITVSVDCCYAVDEDGKLWVWGANSYGALGYPTSLYTVFSGGYYKFNAVTSPVCLTNTQGVFYQKTINKVVNLHGTSVSQAGPAYVLVQFTDGTAVYMGENGKVVNSYGRDLYRSNTTPYPTPKSVTLDGLIVEVYYADNNNVYMRTDNGKYYRNNSSTGVYDITRPEYEGKTLEEIFGPKPSTPTETTYTVDNTTHTITYKYGTTEKSFSYPSNITAIKGFVENPTSSSDESITIYLIDENNDLWIKGRNSGIGRYSDEFICLTTRGFMSEEIWDTIRGRWNLIDRKY